MNKKSDTVKKWLLKADEDLGMAIIAFQYLPKYRDTIAFHCQQAVEKYLKGYLIFLDNEYPKMHDLVYLPELISSKI